MLTTRGPISRSIRRRADADRLDWSSGPDVEGRWEGLDVGQLRPTGAWMWAPDGFSPMLCGSYLVRFWPLRIYLWFEIGRETTKSEPNIFTRIYEQSVLEYVKSKRLLGLWHMEQLYTTSMRDLADVMASQRALWNRLPINPKKLLPFQAREIYRGKTRSDAPQHQQDRRSEKIPAYLCDRLHFM